MAKNKYSVFIMASLILVASSQAGAFASPTNALTNFADPTFRRTWERTDSLVNNGRRCMLYRDE